MKKVKYLLFGLLLMVVTTVVNAAGFAVSANKSVVTVGSTVNVTVSASGGAGWEYCLSFDESLFSLTSANSDTGGKCVLTGSTLTGYSKVTFTLKAKKSGSGTIGITSAAMYNDNGVAISASLGSVKLTNKTQAEIEASYSTNANLKSLSVSDYEITPEFNKDTLEYSLEVENDVEKVVINAAKADAYASVSGTGEVTLTEGVNTFNILVTAQKGNTKTYVLTITRKELNPIEVNVDGKKMFLVRKVDGLEIPNYYVSDTDKYESANFISEGEDDNIIPVFKSEISGYTLVALKDEEGNVGYYIWDKVTDSYRKYEQLNGDNLILVIEEPIALMDGFEIEKTYKLNDIDVKVYKNDGKSEFGLVYGMNAATGEKGWYQIDLKQGTYQRFNEVLYKEINTEKNKYKQYCLYGVIGLGSLLLIVLILLISRGRLSKKNKKMYAILSSGKVSKEEIEEEEETYTEEESEEETDEEEEEVESEEEEVEEEKPKKLSRKEKKALKKEEKKSRKSKKVEEDEEVEEPEEVEETDNEQLREVEEEEKKELSKKELKKLEKEKLKKEREELKRMQEEFLDE